MSLRVWLPLNGDLKNKGLDDITVVNNGAIIDNNGKIGKCYSFDGTNDYISITNVNYPSIFAGPFSICFWIYSSTDGSRDVYFGNYGISGSGNWLNIEKNTSNQLRFWWNNGAPNKYFTSYNILNEEGWTHVTLTRSENTIKVYKNGIFIDSYVTNLSNNVPTTATMFGIGGDSRHSGDLMLGGKINDFRIYDHALSLKQIQQISKGLVLHYKLDDKYIEPTTNLITTEDCLSNTCYNGATKKYNYGANTNMYKIVGIFQGKKCTKLYNQENGIDMFPYVYISNMFTSNGTNAPEYKTLSFDYYTTISTRISVYKLGNGTGTATYTVRNSTIEKGTGINSVSMPVEKNVWNHIEITLRGETDSNAEWGYIQNRPTHTSDTSNYWLFANMQLETKDHATGYAGVGGIRSNTVVYDSSGYQNNGIIIGNTQTSSDSPKYAASAYINSGNVDYIISQNAIGNPEDAITMNIWFKSSNVTPGSDFHEIFNFATSPDYFEFAIYKTGYFRQGMRINGTRYVINGGSNLLDGNWHMLTATYDGTYIKRYIDGKVILNMTQNVSGTLNGANGKFLLGHYGSNTSYYTKEAYLSDARIYATALSEADIKELYQTSALIDRNQNLYVRELVEI